MIREIFFWTEHVQVGRPYVTSYSRSLYPQNEPYFSQKNHLCTVAGG